MVNPTVFSRMVISWVIQFSRVEAFHGTHLCPCVKVKKPIAPTVATYATLEFMVLVML
jgi:hypothetical protein